jgi:hypothetical protein
MTRKFGDYFYWYLVIALTSFAIVIGFIVDFSSSRNSEKVPKEYAEVSKPLKKTLSTNVIEELQKKKIISKVELSSVKAYTSKVEDNSVTINKELNSNQSKNASGSASLIELERSVESSGSSRPAYNAN